MVMKYLHWLILLTIFVAGIDAQDFSTAQDLGKIDENYPSYQFFSLNDSFAIQRVGSEYTKEQGVTWDSVNKNKVSQDKYGFYRAILFGRPIKFLYGGNYVVFTFEDEAESGMVYKPETLQGLFKKRFKPLPSGVEATCSSILHEGKRVYSTQGATSTFAYEFDGGLLLNTTALPWVEGESDAGIGVKITLSFFTWEMDHELPSKKNYINADSIVIINGYVDFYHPDLFLKNNRIRKLRISSLDVDTGFQKEYTLQDEANFQVVKFPKPVNSVRIEILDVYQGTKYNDTAITALLLPGDNRIDTFPPAEVLQERNRWHQE